MEAYFGGSYRGRGEPQVKPKGTRIKSVVWRGEVQGIMRPEDGDSIIVLSNFYDICDDMSVTFKKLEENDKPIVFTIFGEIEHQRNNIVELNLHKIYRHDTKHIQTF